VVLVVIGCFLCVVGCWLLVVVFVVGCCCCCFSCYCCCCCCCCCGSWYDRCYYPTTHARRVGTELRSSRCLSFDLLQGCSLVVNQKTKTHTHTQQHKQLNILKLNKQHREMKTSINTIRMRGNTHKSDADYTETTLTNNNFGKQTHLNHV